MVRSADLLLRYLSVLAPLVLLLREPTLPDLLAARLALLPSLSLSLLSDSKLRLCSAALSLLCFSSRQLSLSSPLIIRICWS